mmetsp:Transcript_16228/g.29347  ORF Transcript_16228/g.29347 Transcript_16228/m.29347 type:complete len:200 (-) Transcript_16228:54-653(-)
MSECGVVGRHMCFAASGFVRQRRLYINEINVAQNVMNKTGLRISLRMALFGRLMVLCSQSREEYRSLRGRPPRAAGSRIATSEVRRGLPVYIHLSHPSAGSLLSPLSSSPYSNRLTFSACLDVLNSGVDTGMLRDDLNFGAVRNVNAPVPSILDDAPSKRRGSVTCGGIRRLNLLVRSILILSLSQQITHFSHYKLLSV